ncbi:transposase (fragment) [Xenorhabdus bovienii str. Intermedium]|uniref:Transposase n=1 Tax=Xenorhabdus bovienii str. Intermedium TaxID=1379677 RepID=A0A077QKY8_XENBV
MDETYIKIKGQWRYLYRAVDTAGQTIDFFTDSGSGYRSRIAIFP